MVTDDLKSTGLNIFKYRLSFYEVDPSDFIERVVTQDETWVHHFDRVKNAEQTKEAPWFTPS